LEKAAAAARDAASVDAAGRLADMVITLLPSSGDERRAA
jgi:hypothetical protein